MREFRFSPNPNQAHLIDWQPWGEAALAKAQEQDKPVLMAISAVWCYWCHVMDETTYSDPDVSRFINQHYVAVRVDSDQRPDINARYNVGGWPTTAFLTGHGGFIAGATYLPADQLLAMLGEVRQAYQEDKPGLYDQARELSRRRKEHVSRVRTGPEISESLVDRAARSMAGAYDPVNGGFGEAPKFPNAPVLAFLLHMARTTGENFYRAMLRKTLDRMAGSGIWDREEGGFFRHCVKSDWSEAQWEKLLEDNLSLTQVYAGAGLLLGEAEYLRVAGRTVDYLLENLFDKGASAFRGSQGAHSEYFGLPLASRRRGACPPVDSCSYADANARAVPLLLDASWQLERPDLRDIAVSVLSRLDAAAQEGQLSHVYSESGPVGGPAFLGDWSQLLKALLAAHFHTGDIKYLDRGVSAARYLVDRFFDEEHGGFFDTEADSRALGYLQIREKPLAENLAAALGLLALRHATGNGDYGQLAEATISAFVETYREHGEFAASFGLTVHLWANSPVEVTVEGPAGHPTTQTMLRASAGLTYPHVQVKPVLTENIEPPARAHVCLDTVCLPPVTDPDVLEDTLDRMISNQAAPFENIFDRFPGL